MVELVGGYIGLIQVKLTSGIRCTRREGEVNLGWTDKRVG